MIFKILFLFSITLGFSQTFKTIQLKSNILNEDREIQIFLPKGYDKSTKTYSTLYVLDGQFYFYYGVGFQQSFKWRNKSPEFIVVFIIEFIVISTN